MTGRIVAERYDASNDLERGETAEHSGDGTKNAIVRAANFGGVGILPNEASVAGLSGLPSAVDAELPLEPPDGCRNQGYSQGVGGIGDGKTGAEIVAAIQDHVDICQ